MVHDSRRAALSREVWLSIHSPSGASVILGYACCPFCGNSVLVPRCDFIRHDPLRGNPALVPVCEFIRHACGPLCGNGTLGAISFALPVALSATILCGFHHATSFAMPVAFYEALQRWLHNAIIGYACCLFCGKLCLSHNAISFAMTLSASIQRFVSVCDFIRHACCLLCGNPVRVCGYTGFSYTDSRGH